MDPFETSIYKRYQSIVESFLGGRPAACAHRAGAEPRRVRMAELLDRYDAFCFDGYGTLYNRGDFVYPGALEWFRALRAAGKQLRLVTNAASNTDDVLAAEADARGFDFVATETVSSGSLLKDFVKRLPDAPRDAYYIGRATGVNVLAECGIAAVENPVSPVVIFDCDGRNVRPCGGNSSSPGGRAPGAQLRRLGAEH